MSGTKFKDRPLPNYTFGEEMFNMVTHIVGGVWSLVALALCLVVSFVRRSPEGTLTSVIYGLSVAALFVISSVYHGLRRGGAKKVMQVIDHCAIYFMIAGTYTPVLICAVLRVSPAAAWITFAVVWGLAALAVTLTAIDLKKFEVVSMICYIGIGWAAAFIFPQLYAALSAPGVAWLLAGGILYTVGAIIYGIGKKIRYMHGVFHIFVLLGSISHTIVILKYVLAKL